MASKVARSARSARLLRDRWKAKAWYKIHAPGMLNFAPVGETIATEPEAVQGRITNISLQDITQDHRHKNIMVRLQINQARGYNLYTKYLGHQLTNDYIRLLTRRRHSKVDGTFDLTTNDEVKVRLKPMVITDKRIQTSQQRAIRALISLALDEYVPNHSLAELFHEIYNGDLNRNMAKDARKLYPTKRIEIRKMEVLAAPELMEVPPDPDKEAEEEESEEEGEEEEPEDQEAEAEEGITEAAEEVEAAEEGEGVEAGPGGEDTEVGVEEAPAEGESGPGEEAPTEVSPEATEAEAAPAEAPTEPAADEEATETKEAKEAASD